MNENSPAFSTQSGLTKREYLAGLIMSALTPPIDLLFDRRDDYSLRELSKDEDDFPTDEVIAKKAVKLTDALIAALEGNSDE